MNVHKVPAADRDAVSRLLVSLGWRIPRIAMAIGWSESTMKGLNAPAPSKSYGDTRRNSYGVTFEYWVEKMRDPGSDNAFKQARAAIENLLEIDKIEAAVRAVEESFALLCRPRCAPALQPYIDLAVEILELKFVNGIGELDVWADYLGSVYDGIVFAPVSAKEAIDCLTDRFSTACDYSAVMPTVPIDLRYLLNGWMSSRQFFTQRQRDAIAYRFALDRIGSKNPAKIGSVMGITRYQVLAALRSGMAELRKDWRIEKLAPFFESFGRLRDRNAELEGEVNRLCEQNHDLVVAIQDGTAGDDLRKVEEQRLIIALSHPVSELDLSVREKERLASAGILLIGHLVQCTEAIMTVANRFSVKAIPDIRDYLTARGLSLGMPLEESVIALFPLPPRVQAMLDKRRRINRQS